ncbi:Aminoacyl-tRNA editing domain-containing protein [Clostridium cavendishii DSM 21758]|uniref:Aminoacyl-tRNA editing domain-containing protein n=1 Tax=Clostridium cavendishii DSM 21758 TaxID=1121302 RepID=A0A1M6FB70_9CLOT|nr:YbaK/EbsC family protein [Clostridium cavendishii]SHI94915.1 Aminoacyl-tRNA editing domain-containing protein [Clostridium cavendishii DSM 21758]
METIRNILIKSGYLFEFIYNEKPIYIAQDGVDYFKIDINQTAATLILYTEKGFYALVTSGGGSRVDFRVIKKELNCKNIRLATKEEVKEVTNFSVGTVPLFNLSLPYIVDKRLIEFPFIYGGSGDLDFTLKVDPQALLSLNDVVMLL